MKTWRNVGRVAQLSSAETETPEEAAPVTDEAREAVLARFIERLDGGVVGSHIRPGDDLWIRVDRANWVAAAEAANAGNKLS